MASMAILGRIAARISHKLPHLEMRTRKVVRVSPGSRQPRKTWEKVFEDHY